MVNEEACNKASPSKEAVFVEMNHRTGVHFIGIGGVGMSGLARICVENGLYVSGSDLSGNEQTKALEALGAKIHTGHAPEAITDEVGRVVVSTAIDHRNVEILEARRRNIPIIHRSDLLAELFLDARISLAVSGCHGKTTVTSMVSTILVETGQDPTCVVGGNVSALGGNSRFGHSGILVAEADESDATFMKYFPHSAVITNLDNDHMDHYASIDSIVKAFEVFAGHVLPSGTLYVCYDDPIARNIALPEDRRIRTFGIDYPADIMAVDIQYFPYGSSFTLTIGGVRHGTFELSVPGHHNVQNALPAIAFALDLGLGVEEIRDGLKKFRGAGRRFEVKGTFDGVTIIDDYGHHPNEIKATLAAAKNLNAKRVVVVFQPHRYTRTSFLCSEFGRCFDDCDRLIITDIYPASEKPIDGVTSRLILDHMPVFQRRKVKMVKSPEDAIFQLLNQVESGDVVFTIGAGNITQVGPEFLEAMRVRASQMADLASRPAV
jgi:UDP-N-acetylmuramate--alanine ligase